MKISTKTTLERQDSLDGDNLFLYDFAGKFAKNKRVLDVGTGYGFGADYLFQKGAKKVTAIDIDKDAIQYAKKTFDKENMDFRTMDATKMHFPQKHFDLVVALEVIEHLPKDKHAIFLKRVKEILDVGGVLVLSTPNKLVNSPNSDIPYNPYHFKEYNPQELKLLVKKYFAKTELLGMKIINEEFNTKFHKLDKQFRYKIFKFLGKHKIVRDAIILIPKKLKKNISGEANLPKRSIKDFKAEKNNIEVSRNLLIIARKSN